MKLKFKLSMISLAIMTSFNSQAHTDPSELESMVVTATRNETSTLNAPASITVVDDGTMARRQTLRIGDALKDTPGLYLRGSMMGNNFPGSGQSTMAFHGISGSKRSLLLIDGQPINSG